MNGVLPVLKPPGMTSHDVVAFVRRLTGEKRVGHAGTLDPGAAGVLVVCLGRATRLVQFLKDDKEYRAEVTFGCSTTTGDASGEVVFEGRAEDLTAARIEEALEAFRGEIWQVPPMTSALRHRGQRLYELARRGIEVERAPRKVHIHALRLVRTEGLGTPRPRALLDITCSAGTYVRSLCADLGKSLGCGAYMSFLLRTRAGIFTLHQCLTLEEVREAARAGRLEEALTPAGEALAHLPRVVVRPAARERVLCGGVLFWPGVKEAPPALQEGELVRLYDGEEFLAVARATGDPSHPGRHYFQPVRVMGEK
ncbi:tRNA pseudouridine(55) synthase TruB [Desulfovirgula thermocuniculi]|mgnify:CR=1 FL=1|uniref:tRNA pseudouridine(55) synthase TruB n=1 Tax=Desulfovirgula thermocuniculi TaxID=348842 RepID=UPI0003F9462B|nr:tRNA pseudouridine(55) synthase TruB [Desulfovirgula thermocuniculi]